MQPTASEQDCLSGVALRLYGNVWHRHCRPTTIVRSAVRR